MREGGREEIEREKRREKRGGRRERKEGIKVKREERE